MTTQKTSVHTLIEHKERFQYREVYASDLKLIQELYQQQNPEGILDHHFGLPVFVATEDNHVIGYVALKCDHSCQLESYTCIAAGVEAMEISRKLRQVIFDETKKHLRAEGNVQKDNNTIICAAYGFSGVPHFQRAVLQLTQWLNGLSAN